jgi:hypothetical protein
LVDRLRELAEEKIAAPGRGSPSPLLLRYASRKGARDFFHKEERIIGILREQEAGWR